MDGLIRFWHNVAGHLASYMVSTFHLINPFIGKQQWINKSAIPW